MIEDTQTRSRSRSATAVLEDTKALFIRRWGEMGIYWGISRTMAELHALLYISTEPLCTDDIMQQLHERPQPD